ncbi:diaminopimelate epimerase [Parachlamydia sp. AcF125]|uniref:diaminopimelate epimerase n=1 Tax=Parachlamydia sp. AcF125 TaxID=2795736 RepID=UPI001BCA58A3|nr:diaminopimelate epimerase [Parachlamydia sp. AcF125]MBS4167888.1 Diaminopimelate epimerase [Parachlamydia sp. AcF125]
MNLAFSKYNGCGNDFILIDNRDRRFPDRDASFIRRLCQRQYGIGADGLILLELSQIADFRMRIFNADGCETEMCGNGIRCLVKFAQDLGITKKHYTIQTMHSILEAFSSEDSITISMGEPAEIEWATQIEVDQTLLTVHWIDTGVPHAVIFVDEVEKADWMALAPKIRSHPHFSPKGVNVNFAQIQKHQISLRTYERGVEQETLACGTGATAAALAAAKTMNIPSPVSIKTRSGDNLEVRFEKTSKFHNVHLTGSAICTFKGVLT